MPVTNYPQIKRVKQIIVSAFGANEAAGRDIGSCDTFDHSKEWTDNPITLAVLNDADVANVETGHHGTITIACQNITMANLAMAMGGVYSSGSNTIQWGNTALGSESTYYTVYVHGQYADGVPVLITARKVRVASGTKSTLGKAQQVLPLTMPCMLDANQAAGQELFSETLDAVDTTPPTVASWSPLNGASSPAKTSNVVCTFSEPVIAAEAVKLFSAFNTSTGVPIPGAWTYDSAGTVFTFTGSGTPKLPAATACTFSVAAGVRDLAGNALAAGSSSSFTTGA